MIFSFELLFAFLVYTAVAFAQIALPNLNETVPYGDITDLKGLVDYASEAFSLAPGLTEADAAIQEVEKALG